MSWVFWSGELAGIGEWSEVSLAALPGTETTPAFSPDGAQLAFSWDGENRPDFDIYVQAVGSPTPRRLTESPAQDYSPAFSPDGRRIAFCRRAGDYASIYVVSPSGGQAERFCGLDFGPSIPSARPVADSWAPVSLSWSPDQKFLAVVDKSAPEAPPAIFLRDIESREMRQFTFPPAGARGDGSPAFSPDGSTIAFVRRVGPLSADVYLAPLSGDPPRRLTADNNQVFGLAWLPDGRHIVFSSDRAGEPALWKIPAEGGTPGRIAGIGDGALFPAVSGQRNRLAYVRRRGHNHIWRVPLRGGGAHSGGPLQISIEGNESVGRYSPDGRRIAFTSRQGERREVWVVDAGGENPTQLTSFGSYTSSPRWAPDGRRLAFDSNQTGSWDVYVINANGGEPRQVTRSPGEDMRPSWSRDGKWIYFGSDRSGTVQIWKKPAEGAGEAIQVTRKGGYDGIESPDGRHLYYTRRGVHGLWRLPVNGGEEELILEDLRWQHSRNWALDRDGIYYMSCEVDPASAERCSVTFRNLATGATERLVEMENTRDSGFSVSPDGEWLLYTKEDDAETDIMVVKNFQ